MLHNMPPRACVRYNGEIAKTSVRDIAEISLYKGEIKFVFKIMMSLF